MVRITGWDVAEVVPADIARCNVPGWLWGDVVPGTDGSLLEAPGMDEISELVRRVFINKMEQLQPGYFQAVVAGQTMHLGLLGQLARNGLDLTRIADRSFYDDAFVAITNSQ